MITPDSLKFCGEQASKMHVQERFYKMKHTGLLKVILTKSQWVTHFARLERKTVYNNNKKVPSLHLTDLTKRHVCGVYV